MQIQQINKSVAQRMLVDAFQLPWILYYYLLEEIQLYIHGNEEEGEGNVLLTASDYKV